MDSSARFLRMPQIIKKAAIPVLAVSATLALVVLGSTVVKIWPSTYFWVEQGNARMPVWVRGNMASGTFVVFIHGGPGSCGTAESIFEVNPADGHFDHPSPLQALESDLAMVYWDQRHSGMSGGSADPNESRIEDFGEDLAEVIRALRTRQPVKHVFLVGQSWGHSVALSYLTLIDGWQVNQAGIDGYVVYKANQEQEAAYEAARKRIIRHAAGEITAGRDTAYWQAALRFYEKTPNLLSPADVDEHDEYAARTMGVSYSLPRRIWASFKASIYSPLAE